MTEATLAWRGEDDAARFDHAVVRADETGLSGHGTSITAAYSLSWNLDATDQWRTRSLGVTVRGDGWRRSVFLTRSPSGWWSAETDEHGDVDLPPAGLDEPEAFTNALDCDLGLCPLTNTMPIRRLGLLDAEVPETPLVMALVEVPSLRVFRSEQFYRSAGEGRVGFRSGSFIAELTVDEYGFIVGYPGLARRVTA